MDKKDIFRIYDDDLHEQISKDYPVLTDEETERIYSKICERLGTRSEENEKCSVVSGVEHYRRPMWHKIFGIAAAAVLVVTVAGGAVLMKRSHVNPNKNKKISSFSDECLIQTAEELTDSFIGTANILSGAVPLETGEKEIVFYQYSADSGYWDGDDVVYRNVVNSDLESPRDAVDMLDGVVTAEYKAELEESGGELFDCGLDAVAGVVNGDDAPVFKAFRNELYTTEKDETAFVFYDTPTISERNDTYYVVKRKAEDDMYFQIVYDGSHWLINDMERK